MTAVLSISSLSHRFASPGTGEAFPVLDEISFAVDARECVAVVGPSGCGKTTLLNLVAGLLTPMSGTIEVNGNRAAGPSRARTVLFQDLRLFFWMTAIQNVAFPFASDFTASEGLERAKSLLDRVGLGDFPHHYPHQLSAGMRQRLALARALAAGPDVLLMDEPLGSLDVQSRVELEYWLAGFLEQEKITVLFVTHDVEQAIYLADRVIVLSSRPARVVRSWPVELARPRRPELRETNEFYSLTRALWTHLRHGASE